MTKKLGIIIGSLRDGSFTRQTADAFVNLLPDGFEATEIRIDNLPFYNEDLDGDNPPAEWQAARKALHEVQGVLFFTPEYNRSIPAAVKNVLDVASRPRGGNEWAGKPALVVSVSPGAIGGFGANHALRQTLTFLDMPTLQQPEAYIGGVINLMDNGKFVPQTEDYFKLIVDKYIEFFNRFQ